MRFERFFKRPLRVTSVDGLKQQPGTQLIELSAKVEGFVQLKPNGLKTRYFLTTNQTLKLLHFLPTLLGWSFCHVFRGFCKALCCPAQLPSNFWYRVLIESGLAVVYLAFGPRGPLAPLF